MAILQQLKRVDTYELFILTGWAFIQSWVLYGNTLYLWPQVPHPSSGIPGEFQIRNINSGFAHCAGFTGRSMVDLKDQVFICTFFSQLLM